MHDRGCIPILAQSCISNILMQRHSDVSFIHKCELDERAAMMMVRCACVYYGRQHHSGDQTVCKQQQPNYASRVPQSQSTHTMEMHETTCASTHSTGGNVSTGPCCACSCHRNLIRGNNTPYIIPHVGTNIPLVSGHAIHAMRDTILICIV